VVLSASPERGQLLDYNGTPLSASEVRWQPAVNLLVLRGYPIDSGRRFVHALARELDFDGERLADMNGPDWRALKERHVPARITESRVHELQAWLGGSEWRDTPDILRFIKMPGRFYPQREVASNLVGFVNRDGHGQEGMEAALNGSLSDGSDSRLSIDIDVQRRLAASLQRAIDEHRFLEANAVVIELDSQRVVAMVSLPGFDPAIVAQHAGPHVRLRPVTDAFQAGPMLQPFLLNELLSSATPESPTLRESFVRGESAVGTRMVNALGYEVSRSGLESAELLRKLDIDFPGAIRTLERRTGTAAELLRDLGNGSGIAPPLLRYSISLAGMIHGRPLLPTRILIAAQTPPSPALSNEGASRAQALRAAMVERARLLAGDPRADFGGMWASYDDRVETGEPVRRAAIALFTPAAQPKYLVTANFVTSATVRNQALLEIGRGALRDISERTTLAAASQRR
jgi:hypothetical protein